jgi:NADH:ubiquinone oxidoreductase subunit 6 (subunit J)
MMLNIRLTEINENVLRYLPVGGLIGVIFLFEVFLIVDNEFIPVLSYDGSANFSLFEIIGWYTTFFF